MIRFMCIKHYKLRGIVSSRGHFTINAISKKFSPLYVEVLTFRGPLALMPSVRH
jgi:hypothetical protein